MADIFDFYVYDDRSIQYAIAEPIMLEDKDVTQFRFRIPKSLNGFDMSDWEWWFIFVNPNGTKYTTLLELTDDEDEPDDYSVATYTVGYGFSGYVGSVSFSIEAFNVSGEDIVNEWHTKTYTTHVIDTLQGTRAVIPEPEGQTIDSLISNLDARVTALEAGGSGLSQTEKNLILTLFSKAAYAESDASTAYNALEALWAVTTRTVTYNLSHVTSSNTASSVEGGSEYTTTLTAAGNYSIDSVTVTMGGVDVTATYYNSGTITIPRVTGDIVITATAVLAATSITATYTQPGTVYDTASLDDLRSDLVVTANYLDGTSATVTNYTLSGTLVEGTNTITVTYGGQTDTFNVTVTHYSEPGKDWTSGVPYDMTDGATKNYYLNNGVETAYNGWDISPYMECRGAFIISDTSFTLNYCAGYDSEDSYVQRVNVLQGTPTNYDALGCISFRVSDASSRVAGAVITPYKLPELSEATAYDTSQYYAPSEWIEGGYANTSTGAIATNSGYKYSGYMNCYNASVLTDNVIQQFRSYAFYDGDKNFISGAEIATSDTTKNKQTSIPSGARYFRVSTITGQYNLCFKFE